MKDVKQNHSIVSRFYVPIKSVIFPKSHYMSVMRSCGCRLSSGSKRKRLTEEQTPVPEEPEKNEVKNINTQDEDDRSQTQSKPEEVKSDALRVSEKREETREEKNPRGEEVRAGGSAGGGAVRSGSELTSLCVSLS